MTEKRFKEMVSFMRAAWPNKMEGWPQGTPAVWMKALEPFSDDVVDYAVRELTRSTDRNQEFPFSLTEIISRADRAQRYLISQGYKL